MESISTTLAEITASIKEIREQQALTNAEVGRFQHELATIRSFGGETSGRDPERASVMRTPQVERAPVRRTLQPSGSTATTSHVTPTTTRTFISPSKTPEEEHAEVERFETKQLVKLMRPKML